MDYKTQIIEMLKDIEDELVKCPVETITKDQAENLKKKQEELLRTFNGVMYNTIEEMNELDGGVATEAAIIAACPCLPLFWQKVIFSVPDIRTGFFLEKYSLIFS